MIKKEQKTVNISLIKKPEKNTRIHPEKQIAEIRRSLQKWGQIKNIVTDENYIVLAGNGLLEAMLAEGMKKVSVVILYDLTENEKKKLMMADNKTAGLGIDNLNVIEEFISEFNGDFDIPGFDDEVLNSISAASDEISKVLDDYGKATEENLDEIDAHADVNINSSGSSDDSQETADENEAENNSVKCPNCGADVWL